MPISARMNYMGRAEVGVAAAVYLVRSQVVEIVLSRSGTSGPPFSGLTATWLNKEYQPQMAGPICPRS